MPTPEPKVDVVDSLPPLSWLADLRGGRRVLVGREVEVIKLSSGVRVFEGAWDDDFGAGGFAASPSFYGSGIAFDEEGVTFSTSSDTVESLYVMQSDGGFLVSNSLSFLIGFGGVSLRTNRKIFHKMLSIKKGINDYESKLYEADRIKILRYCYCNFRIVNGSIHKLAKKEPPHFHSYEDYTSYLVQTLKRIIENAESPTRKVQHRLLTTVSSGYDSVACASLACLLGGKLALTIRTDRGGLADSGKAVADALGLDCIEEERVNPDSYGEHAEAEFIVGGSGGDCIFLSFERHLTGSILFTGFHGDKLWDLHAKPTTYIKRGDDSGTGLQEFRLRKGFINVPVPFIGAIRHPELYEIAHGQAMSAYRLGADYDRPIARRIAEERGVPRLLFGQAKKASGFMFMTQEAALPDGTRRAVDQFILERCGITALLLERLHRAPRNLTNSLWRFSNRRLAAGKKRAPDEAGSLMLRACRKLSLRLDRMYRALWPFDRYQDFLFIWAIERTAGRYHKMREVSRSTQSCLEEVGS